MGCLPEGYLNDNGDIEVWLQGFGSNNQLLCFNPNIGNWTNPQCFGSIPTPRSHHASAMINDKVWIFGGRNDDFHSLGDMFELRMSSLTWNQIQTPQSHIQVPARCTLTPAADHKLVLHGGRTTYESPRHNPGLRCNPGHVVIIFTRAAVTNGARRYDSTT